MFSPKEMSKKKILNKFSIYFNINLVNFLYLPIFKFFIGDLFFLNISSLPKFVVNAVKLCSPSNDFRAFLKSIKSNCSLKKKIY